MKQLADTRQCICVAFFSRTYGVLRWVIYERMEPTIAPNFIFFAQVNEQIRNEMHFIIIINLLQVFLPDAS